MKVFQLPAARRSKALGAALLLALMCCNRPAAALSYLQETSVVLGADSFGSSSLDRWTIDRFSNDDGKLQSVVLELEIRSVINATVHNPYRETPLTASYRVNGRTLVYLVSEGFHTLGADDVAFVTDPITLAPDERVRLQSEVNRTVSFEITDPLLLDAFSGPGGAELRFDERVLTSIMWGWATEDVSINARLTYTYAVPDVGSTLWLLVVSILVFVVPIRWRASGTLP